MGSTSHEYWSLLADDEMKHASWIRILKEQIGVYAVYEGRFNSTAVKTFTNYLGRELHKLDSQKIPLIEALSTTLYIEKSLIENQFFEVFKTDSAELKRTLARLRDDTLVHRDKAKETLDRWKKNQ